jgi:hypothetical protein
MVGDRPDQNLPPEPALLGRARATIDQPGTLRGREIGVREPGGNAVIFGQHVSS